MFGIDELTQDVAILESIVRHERVVSKDYNEFRHVVLERLDLQRSNINRLGDKLDNLFTYLKLCEVINKERTVVSIDSKQDVCNCK